MVDKFRGYKKFQRFINRAPKQVLQALRAGWSEIEYHPEVYFRMEEYGNSPTRYAPGWYGKSPDGKWGIICKDNKNPDRGQDSCCCYCSH